MTVEKLLLSIKNFSLSLWFKNIPKPELLWFAKFPCSLNKPWVNNKYRKRFSLISEPVPIRMGTWVNVSPWVPLSTFLLSWTKWSSAERKWAFLYTQNTKKCFVFGRVRQKGHLFCIIPEHDTQNNSIGSWEGEMSLR